MKQPIIGYVKDDEDHWVAKLGCGHHQHVRHDPPWTNRPWVITKQGREQHLNMDLECKKCDQQAPRDFTLSDPMD
ncbi:conserved hypothetical protein [Paraglaciecola sp. T6c]|uniref:DUF3565 domain-containing protein n=1 Tax=Pseudoalteromonas atlantica (strain T6c / ATCC BAA-1087) TaxID=3042615 RepID=UPI00005C6E3C|nr:DUF3565 domain-containing protein [Paraglaciecola sp. T6c]ABG40286.1 conserved hypothetical protein [Paraglaciecola sp. T6c]